MKDQLIQKLEDLKSEAHQLLMNRASEDELYDVKVKYLGKKGSLTHVLKDLSNLPPEDRPIIGALANRLKKDLEQTYSSRLDDVRQNKVKQALAKEAIDTSLDGFSLPQANLHPLSAVLSEMKDIFKSMGFDVYEGPEIESDYYNFEALNIPKDHPARDMQDTFYLDDDRLLRTHTSPVQIRVMQKQKPPIQMIAPGVVYRCDSDVSHSPMFHQIEGLMVDEKITMGHLKGVVEYFLKKIFDAKTKVKFRPSFFPFTEPSMEVDIGCVICEAKGCRVCKQSGWLEIMGCGMVDPNVFSAVKIDPEKFSGFAFGIGVERVCMLKYGINDIRLFYESRRRFLEQF